MYCDDNTINALVEAGYTPKEALDLFLKGEFECNSCQIRDRIREAWEVLDASTAEEALQNVRNALGNAQGADRLVVAHAIATRGFSDGRFYPRVKEWARKIVNGEEGAFRLPMHSCIMNSMAILLMKEDGLF